MPKKSRDTRVVAKKPAAKSKAPWKKRDYYDSEEDEGIIILVLEPSIGAPRRAGKRGFVYIKETRDYLRQIRSRITMSDMTSVRSEEARPHVGNRRTMGYRAALQ